MSIRRTRLTPEESRSAALAAARKLLLEQGPQAVTLKAVAADIGRTHANLLHHFGSAAGLQGELAKSIADSVNGRIADAVERARAGETDARVIVDQCFDARRSARWRKYRYTIVNRDAPDPFRARYAWWVPEPLELARMRLASDPFLGEHDFSSFCRKGPEGSTAVRRVFASGWRDEGDGLLVYEIRASSFCWQMVRSIVGTLADVGIGKIRPGEILAILRARDRGAAGRLAPPGGLCLWDVGYELDTVTP